MKFQCDRQTLSDILNNVSRGVSAKSNVPVLEGLLLTLKNGILTVTAYDLELGIRASFPVRMESEGEIILPGRLFTEMVRRFEGETVLFEADEKYTVNIRCGDSLFDVIGMDANDYPQLPEISDYQTFAIDKVTFSSMVRQTLFAVAKDESRPVHKGSKITLGNGEIEIASVDGYRLALRREKMDSDGDASFIVPGKTLAEVQKLIAGDEEGQIGISLARKYIVFSVDGYTFISRLLEGEFLNYKETISFEGKVTVQVNARKVIDCLERAGLLIRSNVKSYIICKIEEDAISFHCRTALGKFYDRIPATVTGEGLSIGFDISYLLDALRNSETDELRFEIVGPLSPMKIVPVNGDSFLFIVTPVRIKGEISA